MAKTSKSINDHPRFDRKTFRIHAKGITSLWERIPGQPQALLVAMKELLGKRSTVEVSGDRLREYLERNKPRLFPGTAHDDVLRIFQIDSRTLKSFGVIEDLGAVPLQY